MIEIDKRCYIIYDDPNPECSYEGWGVVTGYKKSTTTLKDYYQVTILNDLSGRNEEYGLFFPFENVYPHNPKANSVKPKEIFQEDVGELTSKCLDIIIKDTGIPDDSSHDPLYEDLYTAISKFFRDPAHRNYN